MKQFVGHQCANDFIIGLMKSAIMYLNLWDNSKYMRVRQYFHELKHSFFDKKHLYLNVVSRELNTLRSMFLQFFDSFQIPKFVEVLKIDLCLGDDILIEARSLCTEPYLQVSKQKIITRG